MLATASQRSDPCVFWGIAVLLLTIPTNSMTLRVLNRLNIREALAKDARTKKTSEAITNMKLLKLMGWETHFKQNVEMKRAEELKRHLNKGAFRSLNQAISNAVPAIVLVVTLTAYRRTGRPIVASTIFTAISLFNQLRFPLLFYPMVIDALANGKNALRRLSTYLCQEDMTQYVQRLPREENDMGVLGGEIDLKNGNFAWSKPLAVSSSVNENRRGGVSDMVEHSTAAAPALCGVDLHVGPGEIVAVVGNVGSGKSALVKALLGELEPVPRIVVDESLGNDVYVDSSVENSVNDIPSVTIKGNVAYCSQESWLSKGSIREAVLFGREYDEKKYLSVMYDSGLDDDIASGTLSHETQVGEGGSSLSGGQRARVQLARALYEDNTGAYLLDDPLSALDAAVGAVVFERVTKRIRDRKAAAVFVTNDISLPRRCDRVVLMGKTTSSTQSTCSRVVDIGTYDELLSRGHDLKSITIHDESDEEIESSVFEENDEISLDQDKERLHGRTNGSRDIELSFDVETLSSVNQTISTNGQMVDKTSLPTKKSEVREEDATMDDKMSVGAVPRSTYMTYFKSVKSPLLILATLSCFLFSNGAQFFQQYTVAKWTELGHDSAMSVALGSKYLQSLVYAAGAVSVFLWLRSYLLMRVGVRASEFLHNKMLSSVFKAPVTFFDKTPSGQLLSRFGKELETVDRGVPDGISSVLFCFLNIGITAAGLTGLMTPSMVVPLVFISMFYTKIMSMFRPVARDLKRFESKSRSPIYTQFGEALQGAETIRSFSNTSTLWSSNLRSLIDTNLSVFYSVKAVDRWLSIRLESLGNVVVLVAAFASVILTRTGKMKSGSAGWGLTQSLAITGLLTWAVRVLTDLESQMMSVMRVTEVTDLGPSNSKGTTQAAIPQEKMNPGEALNSLYSDEKNNLPSAPVSDKALSGSGWPWMGGISFNNVSMRYSPSAPRALKNVNIDIPPGSTLGVVGRTGSGKSTLLVTLFRLVEIESGGSIKIDGVDIRSVSLQTLRQSLSIIPQDPTLFSGTLAYNLDATGKASEEEAWEALHAASPQLAEQYRISPNGLESIITEGGKNLSAGQRQLICLARALLRKSKILVLDEATSSVDPTTDAQVQETIRNEFVNKGVSVITVAHRLDTVLGSDKIAVLGSGELIEYGTPEELLDIQGGHFRRLVDADMANKKKGAKVLNTNNNMTVPV